MNEITSLTALEQYAQGQIVELPGFGDGQPFVARLRRPSLMVLIKSGKVPNALLATANSPVYWQRKCSQGPLCSV